MISTLIYLFVIPILSAILLLVNFGFAPHRPYKEKKTPFECGYHSFLQTRTQFTVSFFIFGLLFLIFDLEIVLIYPITVSVYFNSIYGLTIVIVFVLILALGFVFELGKNALKIETKQEANEFITKSLQSNNNFFWSSLLTIVITLVSIRVPFGIFFRILFDSYFFFLPVITFMVAILSQIILHSFKQTEIKNKKLIFYGIIASLITIIILSIISLIKWYFADYLIDFGSHDFIINYLTLISSIKFSNFYYPGPWWPPTGGNFATIGGISGLTVDNSLIKEINFNINMMNNSSGEGSSGGTINPQDLLERRDITAHYWPILPENREYGLNVPSSEHYHYRPERWVNVNDYWDYYTKPQHHAAKFPVRADVDKAYQKSLDDITKRNSAHSRNEPYIIQLTENSITRAQTRLAANTREMDALRTELNSLQRGTDPFFKSLKNFYHFFDRAAINQKTIEYERANLQRFR